MNSNFIKSLMQAAFIASQTFCSIFFLASLLAFSGLVLTGCGGGKASSTSTENTLPSPVAGSINGEVLVPGPTGEAPVIPSALELLPQVSVGQRQFADPNVLLNLRGTVVAAKGAQIVKTLWTQVTGPQVIIPSPLALDNVVLMPDVSIATQLEFRLTAQDSEDRVNSATVSILIKPVPTFVKVIGGVFNENSGTAVFKVRLSAPSETPVTISYKTQDGSAKSNTDYVTTSGEVVFAAGEVIKEIPVALINDVIEESDESFSLQVTAIDGETTHANSGVVIIRNGVEPVLPQSIQFTDQGPIFIHFNEKYTNVLNPVAPGTGDIIYSSSNSSIASVDARGVVTGLDFGTTTITATKLFDDIYLSASNSYTLQVIKRGATPVVSIRQSDAYSVQLGAVVSLSGSASDVEDGLLPTAAQIATGKPISSLRWNSSIDGFLGYGDTINTTALTQGTHLITYEVKDSDGNTGSASITVLVGNIAPLATPSASSTFSGYSPLKINDSDLSVALGGLHSWSNVSEEVAVSGSPRWTVYLSWQFLVTINTVDLYTSEGFETSSITNTLESLALRSYEIEYLNSANTWIPLVVVSGNTALHRSHPVTQVTTSQLRVITHGSAAQATYSRVNELVVFGTISSPVGSSSVVK